MSAVGGVVARRARAGILFAALMALVGITLSPASASTQASLSVLVPIVALPGDGGLLTVEELSAGTAPSGAWSQLARAAVSHGATIALDTRIVASITELGDGAPESATSWLASVVRTDPLYLPWGNADPFLLATIGPAFRVSTIQLSEISGIPAADIVGWPTGHAGTTKSIAVTEQLGFTSFIADDVVFPEADGAFSHDLSAQVADGIAVGATTDLDVLAQQLRDAAGHSARLALPRDPRTFDVGRAVALLDALFSGSTRSFKFDPVAGADVGRPTFRVRNPNANRQLMFQHRLDRRVSAIALDPAVISVPRLRQLASIAGQVDRTNFPPLVRAYVREANDYGEFVSFAIGSDFTVLADATELPLTITNSTGTEVTVVATVAATSGIVSIAEPSYTVTIPANSDAQVSVPMESVANGKTSLRATLHTVTGIPISDPVYIEIDVQAQWEGVTLISFVAIVSLIMGIGIARTIRDRRLRA